MALDTQCKAFLDMLAASGGKPLEHLPLEEARLVPRALIEFGGPVQSVARVENRAIPGPAQPIPLRVYWPTLAPSVPALMFFHGGGLVNSDLGAHDRQCRALANESGCVVISVDYRLAPEHKFPAAPEDAYAATRYVAEHAAEFFGESGPDRGGRRQRGRKPRSRRFAHGARPWGAGTQVSTVDLPCRGLGGPRARRMREFGTDHFLTLDLMDWFGPPGPQPTWWSCATRSPRP